MRNLLELIDAYDVLILDMDGTILDLAFDNYLWQTALPRTLARRDGRDFHATRRDVAARIGAARGSLDWYSFDYWSQEFNLDIAALERAERGRIRFWPSAERFLNRLPRHQFVTILATNASRASLSLKIETTGLDRHFDHITCAHEIGHAKEEPMFWQRFLDDHSVQPERAVLIDDNEAALRAAKASKIGLTLGVRVSASGAPPIDSSFQQVDPTNEFELVE